MHHGVTSPAPPPGPGFGGAISLEGAGSAPPEPGSLAAWRAHRLLFARILRLKLRIANNAIVTLKKHVLIHMILFGGLVTCLIIGGTLMFHWMFSFLLQQDLIGPPIVDRLVNLVLLVFFAMLVVSNLIITLTTTYISREVDFYMSQPVAYKDVFFFKLFETVVYSSWAFVILSCPLFFGYGLAKALPLTFYVGVALLMIPFLLIPAAAGAIITMLVAAYLPAKRTRWFFFVLIGIGMVSMIVLARMSGFSELVRSSDFGDFRQTLRLLEVGRLQVLPNTWMAEGTFAAAAGDWKGVAFWFGVMLSNGLMLLQVCLWMIDGLYYKGWCMARAGAGRGRIDPRRSPFTYIDGLYAWMGRPLKALIGKDLRVFWRDPAQWIQLLILVGLLFIYIANIRQAASERGVHIFQADWQTMISFMNMGATCFILSILSTRFFYPLLSLEGRQFWTIGLAPIRRSTLLWQKFFFCQVCALGITLPLMIFSNWVLRVPDLLFWRSIVTLVALSFGLTSLAIGLGAMTPNFREDNPARIANGVGGTMNIVLSLLYIGAVLAIVSVPTYIELTEKRDWIAALAPWNPYFLGGFLLVNGLAWVVPMVLGMRRWNRLEF